jgi:hypothetical protein
MAQRSGSAWLSVCCDKIIHTINIDTSDLFIIFTNIYDDPFPPEHADVNTE